MKENFNNKKLLFFVDIIIIVLTIIVTIILYKIDKFSNYRVEFITIILVISLIPVIGIFVAKITPKKLRVDEHVNKTDKTIYYREIPYNYTPIIVSFIENLKVEYKKDIVAEILFLCKEKNLSIIKVEEVYYIRTNKEIERKNLNRTDWLILNLIDNYHSKDIVKLADLINIVYSNRVQFEESVIADSMELGLITKGGILPRAFDTMTRAFFHFIIAIILLWLYNNMLRIDNILVLILIESYEYVSIIMSGYLAIMVKLSEKVLLFRTKKGKEHFSEWIAFRDYLKDYGNLSQYTAEQIYIWEDYLAYAEVFNISKITKTIKGI